MENNKRTVTILGSTGSIGTNTVDLIARHPDKYKVVALTANSNVEKLAEQARLLKPLFVAVADKNNYEALKKAVFGMDVRCAAGPQALVEAASLGADWTMSAIVGAAGLPPTMEAIRLGKTVALANKETLVCAGRLVMADVARYKTTLLPVDSEHSAIFQVLEDNRRAAIDKIILTASGGPFLNKSIQEMEQMTPAQAVAHPNWSMGAKISVDSASMMNKGLELIEACHLFDMPGDKIDILVHPQSIIHSAVSYVDGSVLAHLGEPDMRTPISVSLAWPDRMATPVKPLDLAAIGKLTFFEPDTTRFPALILAREALAAGGSATTVFNAANEVAVSRFMAKDIGFTDIARLVGKTLEITENVEPDSLENVLEIDTAARHNAQKLVL